MTVYLDTSFAVGLFLTVHPDHRRCRAQLVRPSAPPSLITSAHTLAETYVTLVRNVRPLLTPAAARQLIDRSLRRSADVRAISVDDYDRTLAIAEGAGIVGPLFYDLLHCVCADAADADELWTLNGKDFARLQSITRVTVVIPPAVST